MDKHRDKLATVGIIALPALIGTTIAVTHLAKEKEREAYRKAAEARYLADEAEAEQA